ncbi:ABC-type transport auxiliary lipoprotein family protein [Phenylobacterium sp.]|uniref:ABC-type transport auxiliary lipoprotein family protein n=1 Tax=Phenylobacterium sp. TaxID=1871053 RepID=UPI0030F42F5B
MTRLQRLIRLSAVALTAVALSGCISLFPKSKPAQLYQFAYTAPTEASDATVSRSVGVLKLSSSFVKAAAGDRIMTVTGASDVAYIAEARWASPASVLFEEAVNGAFDRENSAVRLISRGEIGQSNHILKLDVTDFEVVYTSPKARPQVLVTVHATLTRSGDRTVAAERTFTERVQAGEDRQGAIVGAFNAATSQVLSDLVAWTASSTADR